MSAHIKLLTPMTEEECLISAIIDLGFSETDLECSSNAVSLRGWKKGQRANIVLRKEHTGDTYNDIGFLNTATGYTAILSDDHPQFGRDWLTRVNERYQYHIGVKRERFAAEELRQIEEKRQELIEAQRQAVHERAKKLGYQVKETRESGSIHLVLLKRTY